nr:hypothetical protein BaRGS_021411 [Batillaria attramentaria]
MLSVLHVSKCRRLENSERNRPKTEKEILNRIVSHPISIQFPKDRFDFCPIGALRVEFSRQHGLVTGR